MSHSLPSTRALLFLKERGITFRPQLYEYRPGGKVAQNAATELGLDEERVYKTLVFLLDGKPLLALVNATQRVSLARLGAAAGAKSKAVDCSPADAERYTGYQVGGISPFGTRRALPVFLDELALCHETIYLNGGSHGLLLELAPQDVVSALGATVAALAVD